MNNDFSVSETEIQGFIPVCYLPELPLQQLAARTSKCYYRAGEVILTPGMQSTSVRFLLSGNIQLQQAGSETAANISLIELETGFLLPLDLLYSKGAELRASEDSCLIEVEADYLDKLLSWSQASEFLAQELALQSKRADELQWFRTLLASNLFLKVSPLNMQKLLARLVAEPVKQGQVIISQGEMGEACYFIKQGEAAVTRTESSGETKHLADIGYGRCFGEDALVYEKARNATVTMSADGLLMKMEKRDFLELLKEPRVDTISAVDLDLVLGSAVLLDVRSAEEFRLQHMQGSLCTPLNLLRTIVPVLDAHQDYIVYCDTGRRARAATFFLEQMGYRARALNGGLQKLLASQQSCLSPLVLPAN